MNYETWLIALIIIYLLKEPFFTKTGWIYVPLHNPDLVNAPVLLVAERRDFQIFPHVINIQGLWQNAYSAAQGVAQYHCTHRGFIPLSDSIQEPVLLHIERAWALAAERPARDNINFVLPAVLHQKILLVVRMALDLHDARSYDCVAVHEVQVHQAEVAHADASYQAALHKIFELHPDSEDVDVHGDWVAFLVACDVCRVGAFEADGPVDVVDVDVGELQGVETS